MLIFITFANFVSQTYTIISLEKEKTRGYIKYNNEIQTALIVISITFAHF